MNHLWEKCLLCLVFLLFAAPSVALDFQFVAESPAKVNLENPHDLKLSPDNNFLYVSDAGNNRVAILDPDSLELIAEFGADHQSGTHDVDFDAQGRAYVADTHNNRVTIYTIQNNGDSVSVTLVGELKERIRGPEGVLAHPNGRIYVAGAWSGNLVAYQNGQVVAELKGLSSPHDVELAIDGNHLWLADAGNNRMLYISPDLKILRELSGAPYNFDGVRYQDLMEDGTLIVADKNNHVVKVIGPQGDLLQVLGVEGRAGKGEKRLRTPEGVEVRGNRVWISDSGNDRVVQYLLTAE